MLEQLHRLRAVLTSVDYVHALLHRECEHLTDARLAGHEHAAALLHSIAPFASEKLSALFARLSHALPEDAEDPALLAPGFSPGYDEARAARGAVDDKIHALTSRYIAEIGQAHPRFSKSDSKRKFVVTADPAHGMVITTTKAFEKCAPGSFARPCEVNVCHCHSVLTAPPIAPGGPAGSWRSTKT